MRELKHILTLLGTNATASRTPPGVRELKLLVTFPLFYPMVGRTPPGVRELKLMYIVLTLALSLVAPLPGCVN